MSRISEKNVNKIQEDILALLYENALQGLFTKSIADELARDDEFVLALLKKLEKKRIVRQAGKSEDSASGKRRRWVLTDKAYNAYKELL